MYGFAMRALCPTALCLCLVLALIHPAHADSLAQHLKQEYADKNWFLANFQGADHLRYDSSGQALGGVTPGPWRNDSDVKVTGIDVSSRQLRIKAQRLLLHEQDRNGLVFQPTKRKLVIEVQLGPQLLAPADLDTLWSKIFILRVQRFVAMRFCRIDRVRRRQT
jgi:hypothetical protein